MSTNYRTADGWLHGLGRRAWPALVDLAMDQWCWVDLDGAHSAPALPTDPPAGCTHLWGWSANECVRVRWDDGTARVAALAVDRDSRPDATPVTVQIANASPWGQLTMARLSPLGRASVATVADVSFETLTVVGTQPITFVRSKPADG